MSLLSRLRQCLRRARHEAEPILIVYATERIGADEIDRIARRLETAMHRRVVILTRRKET